ALSVAHQGMNVHLVERDFTGEFQAEHDHTRDPEKQNVEAGDQQRRRIERAQIRGVVRPSQGRKWPQSRAEPGIEHVRILLEARAAAVAPFRLFARYDDLFAILAMPRRDAMTPP